MQTLGRGADQRARAAQQRRHEVGDRSCRRLCRPRRPRRCGPRSPRPRRAPCAVARRVRRGARRPGRARRRGQSRVDGFFSGLEDMAGLKRLASSGSGGSSSASRRAIWSRSSRRRFFKRRKASSSSGMSPSAWSIRLSRSACSIRSSISGRGRECRSTSMGRAGEGRSSSRYSAVGADALRL